MSDELIQFPSLAEVKEMLVDARQDIQAEVDEDSELVLPSTLLFKVIDIIEDKISKQKDLNNLAEKDKIDLAAHLCLLNSLEDDFFLVEEDDLEIDEVELGEESPSTHFKQ